VSSIARLRSACRSDGEVEIFSSSNGARSGIRPSAVSRNGTGRDPAHIREQPLDDLGVAVEKVIVGFRAGAAWHDLLGFRLVGTEPVTDSKEPALSSFHAASRACGPNG
jgi:hypothetical protein